MVVIHKKKCIFVHIPKCAGTSMEQFLKDYGNNDIDYFGVFNNRSLHHLTAYELLMSLRKKKFGKYYRFSIVRNPYDRLLSEYYWCPLINIGYKYNKTKDNFLKYVIFLFKNKNKMLSVYNDHFIPQYDFLYENNNLIVNNIFKYEHFSYVNDFLKKKLNINNDFITINKTNFEKEDWTTEQKELIYKLYKNDFILFNYKK